MFDITPTKFDIHSLCYALKRLGDLSSLADLKTIHSNITAEFGVQNFSELIKSYQTCLLKIRQTKNSMEKLIILMEVLDIPLCALNMNNRGCLSLYSWNCNGQPGKILELRKFVKEHNPDIILFHAKFQIIPFFVMILLAPTPLKI